MLFWMETNSRVFRFATFEADPVTGELRKSGIRIRLQEQPFQVLLMLLERPGELLTREELRQRLWPADTFVDFDHSLNTVVNKLREALGDSAANPRFIETLARRGYRFVAPVRTEPESAEVPTPPAPGMATTPAAAPEVQPMPTANEGTSTLDSILTSPHEVPHVHAPYVRALFVLVQIMYLSFYIAALAKFPRVAERIESVTSRSDWVIAVLIVSALIGISVRLFLLAAVAFKVENLAAKFQRLFIFIFALDELWALSPLLLIPQIGIGLSLAASAALVYVPFSQRTLLLMAHKRAEPGASPARK